MLYHKASQRERRGSREIKFQRMNESSDAWIAVIGGLGEHVGERAVAGALPLRQSCSAETAPESILEWYSRLAGGTEGSVVHDNIASDAVEWEKQIKQ